MCVCLGAKSGPADLVGLGKVGYVVLFGAHWRVAGLGAPWRRRCIWAVGLRRRDWRGFLFVLRAAERGRFGGGGAVDNAQAGLYPL